MRHPLPTRVLAAFTLLLVILVAIIAADFAFFRGRTPPINCPGSIASLEKVQLGGLDQWILIRGWDTTAPVVLFLHGGPGMPAMYLAHDFQRQLERSFVIVHWDRRGAGKSYSSGLQGDLTVRQTLNDTYQLTRILRSRFGGKRIYLVGHSWGTYLGMLAAWEHPEYYAAYVGLGQESAGRQRVAEAQKEFLAHEAGVSGDSALLTYLKSSSSKVREDDLFRYGAELHNATNFLPLLLVGVCAPEYTFSDAMNVKKGADLVGRQMIYDVISEPLDHAVPKIDIPVFFFLGRHDYTTPSSLAAQYLDSLNCPLKKLVWFENSAHFPFFEEPERFRLEMLNVDSTSRSFWVREDNSEFHPPQERRGQPPSSDSVDRRDARVHCDPARCKCQSAVRRHSSAATADHAPGIWPVSLSQLACANLFLPTSSSVASSRKRRASRPGRYWYG